MDFEKLTAAAANLPKDVKANAEALIERMGTKIEGIGDEDTTWYPPISKLVQATSDRSKLPKGASIGDIVIGETKMEQPVKVIPMRVWEGRQYWSPDQNEAKMLCSSPDGRVGYLGFNCRECPHAKFNEETRKSECSKIEVVMSISSDLKEIFVTNFAKTNYTVGKEWKGLMKKAAVAPYRRIYHLRGETSKQYKNVEAYKVDVLDGAEKNTADAILPFLQELFTQIGDDRKEMLDNFHAMVQERRASGAGALPAPDADSEIKTITYEGSSEGTVSDMAGKYSL